MEFDIVDFLKDFSSVIGAVIAIVGALLAYLITPVRNFIKKKIRKWSGTEENIPRDQKLEASIEYISKRFDEYAEKSDKQWTEVNARLDSIKRSKSAQMSLKKHSPR